MRNYAIILILILAIFLRSWNFTDGIVFDSDFGRDCLYALRIAKGDLTLIGPQASVGGFYLGPGYFYMIASVFLVFGPHPELISVLFILMGTAAVYLGYVLAKQTVGPRAGLFLALVLATHPLFVSASRAATHMPMMALLTLGFFFCYRLALERHQRLWYLLSGIVFGLFFHVHFSSFLIAPAVALIVFAQYNGRVRDRLVTLIWFGVGILMMLSPLILFDVTHDFLTSRAFFSYLMQSSTGSEILTNHPHLTQVEKLSLMRSVILPHSHPLSLILGFTLLLVVRSRLRLIPMERGVYTVSLLSVPLILSYPGYLYPYYLIIPATVWLLALAYFFGRRLHGTLVLGLGIIIALVHGMILTYPPEYRTLTTLSPLITVIEADQDTSGKPAFTVFKDSRDLLTGHGFEYRFLLARDGYIPVHEQRYREASVLYYIQEDGNKDPLYSTNWETTEFAATKKTLLKELNLGYKTVKIFRLEK